MGDGPGVPLVLVLAPCLERLQFGHAVVFQLGGDFAEAFGLLMIERAHVRLGDGGHGTQHALLAATGTGTVAADERFVVAPHHEVVA